MVVNRLNESVEYDLDALLATMEVRSLTYANYGLFSAGFFTPGAVAPTGVAGNCREAGSDHRYRKYAAAVTVWVKGGLI